MEKGAIEQFPQDVLDAINRDLFVMLARDARLARMGERWMSEVVKEAHQTDDLPRFRHRVFAQLRHLLQVLQDLVAVPFFQSLEHLASHVHDTQAVLEPGVHRPRVNQVLHGKLSNVAEPLEYRMVHDPLLVSRVADETVYWTANPLRP